MIRCADLRAGVQVAGYPYDSKEMQPMDEPEVGREELGGARQHQLVDLSDRDVRHARDVRDLALGPLCFTCLEVTYRLSGGKRKKRIGLAHS